MLSYKIGSELPSNHCEICLKELHKGSISPHISCFIVLSEHTLLPFIYREPYKIFDDSSKFQKLSSLIFQ